MPGKTTYLGLNTALHDDIVDHETHLNENWTKIDERLSDLFYNVKDFGAKGDGATDDTTAIQNAINQAEANKASVLVPKGEYIVTSTLLLKDRTYIKGAGRSKTRLNLTTDNIPLFKSNAYYDKPVLIEDMELYSNYKTRGRTAIKVDVLWGGGITVNRVTTLGFKIGLDLSSIYNSSFNDIICRDGEVGIKAVGNSTSNFNNVNQFNRIVCSSNDVGLVMSNSLYHTFNECNFEANRHALVLYGLLTGIVFDRTWFEANTESIIVPCNVDSSYNPNNTGLVDPNSITFNQCQLDARQVIIPNAVNLPIYQRNLAISKILNKETAPFYFNYKNLLAADRALFRTTWVATGITQELKTLSPKPTNLSVNTVGSFTLTQTSGGQAYGSSPITTGVDKYFAVHLKYRVRTNVEPLHTIEIKTRLIESGTGSLISEGIIYVDRPTEYFKKGIAIIKTSTTNNCLLYLYFNGQVGDVIEISEVSAIDVTDHINTYGFNTQWLRENFNYSHHLIETPSQSGRLDANGDGVADIPYGTTAQRPIQLSSVQTGFQYYDTTLGKPIWWSGTAWKDSTGTTI